MRPCSFWKRTRRCWAALGIRSRTCGNFSGRITNWSSGASTRSVAGRSSGEAWPNSAGQRAAATRPATRCWPRPMANRARRRFISWAGPKEGKASLDQTIIPAHADGQTGATFDQESDVFPEIFPPKSNQRIARGVNPVRRSDDVPHHRRVRVGERFDLLVVIVKPWRATPDFFFHTGIVMVKAGKVPQFALGQIRLQRVTVVKVTAAGCFDAQFLPVNAAEALSIAARMDVRVAPHHAHLLVIPAERTDIRPVTAVEMGVVH